MKNRDSCNRHREFSPEPIQPFFTSPLFFCFDSYPKEKGEDLVSLNSEGVCYRARSVFMAVFFVSVVPL
jgi:hypothetical protein